MAPTRDATAVAMAMALAVARAVDSATIAGGDVLARCQSIVSSATGTQAAQFATVPEASLPSDIAAALAAKSLKWDSLSDPMRVGLLWAYGYVLSSTADKKVHEVYTDCSSQSAVTEGTPSEDALGVQMNAIEISLAEFNSTSCTHDQCGGFSQTNNTQCTADISSTIKCAIKLEDNIPESTGTFWSSASGSATTTPNPAVYTQQILLTPSADGSGSSSSSSFPSAGDMLNQKEKKVSIVTIQMIAPASSADCGNSGDAVIPCLAVAEATDRKFCRPTVDQNAVNTFLDTVASKLAADANTGSDSTTGSGGLSIGAIIGIVGGALVVLGLVAFYFFRSGRKPVESKTPANDPNYVVYNPKNPHHGGGQPRPPPSKTKSVDVIMGEDDTGNSVDRYGDSGGNEGSIRAPNGEPSPPAYPPPRGPRVSVTGPYGKTTEDYMDESEILREFLTDPRILMRRIPHEDLTTLRILSKGSYGEVYLGQLETRHVAMKRLLPEKKHILRSIEQFTGEIRLMTQLEHRNIVSFIGVSWDQVPNICAVVEYMDNGDLAEVLAKSKGRLTWPKEKISISMDIAEGLVYLHSMRPVIVHRDLKSKNVLLNKRGQAKLSDFGVSRKTTVNETMTSGVGTLLWTAPEIIEGRKYSEKADIFSLGVVLSEIDTGEEPYASIRNDTNNERLPGMQIVQMVRLGELKVRFRDDCPPKIRELAEQCTSLDPDMRPTSMEVAYTLKSIIAPMLRR